MTRDDGGGTAAVEALFSAAYESLRAVAASYLRGRGDGSVDAAMLVHEAYLRLRNAAEAGARWESEEHFRAVAAKAMRQVLVDGSRRRLADKRGGAWERVTLTGLGEDRASMTEVLTLDDALRRLEGLDPRQSRIVELRVFGGLTVAQIAQELGLSESAVEKDWRRAREWLAGVVGEAFRAG